MSMKRSDAGSQSASSSLRTNGWPKAKPGAGPGFASLVQKPATDPIADQQPLAITLLAPDPPIGGLGIHRTTENVTVIFIYPSKPV